MNERERSTVVLLLVGGLVLQVIFHRLFELDFRAPRFATVAVIVIGLRWGSVAGAWLGALAGVLLALASGEPPFAGTAALALVGFFAGEAPRWVVLESYRAITVAAVLGAVIEIGAISLLRGFIPPGGLRAAIWAAGWTVAFVPLLYWLIDRASAESPDSSRLPSGNE